MNLRLLFSLLRHNIIVMTLLFFALYLFLSCKESAKRGIESVKILKNMLKILFLNLCF